VQSLGPLAGCWLGYFHLIVRFTDHPSSLRQEHRRLGSIRYLFAILPMLNHLADSQSYFPFLYSRIKLVSFKIIIIG